LAKNTSDEDRKIYQNIYFFTKAEIENFGKNASKKLPHLRVLTKRLADERYGDGAFHRKDLGQC